MPSFISRLRTKEVPELARLVKNWASFANLQGAMSISNRIKVLAFLAYHEESQRECKMEFVVRHALLGESRENPAFRIHVGDYV